MILNQISCEHKCMDEDIEWKMPPVRNGQYINVDDRSAASLHIAASQMNESKIPMHNHLSIQSPSAAAAATAAAVIASAKQSNQYGSPSIQHPSGSQQPIQQTPLTKAELRKVNNRIRTDWNYKQNSIFQVQSLIIQLDSNANWQICVELWQMIKIVACCQNDGKNDLLCQFERRHSNIQFAFRCASLSLSPCLSLSLFLWFFLVIRSV